MKRKVIIGVLSIFIIAVLVIFTIYQRSENAPKKVIKLFLNKFYTVEDYNKYAGTELTDKSFSDNYLKEKEYKNIMMSEVYKDFAQNQVFLSYLLTADLGKFNASPKKINIEKYTILEDKSVIYNYNIKIETSFADSNQKEEQNDIGQITMIKVNNKWLISKINKFKPFTDNSRFSKFRSLQ
ncbi:MAG: hypothetical protein LIR50_17945 [Bacillota bacterium]|nr:hypothetical protein [Bacillota bacterium]